MIAPLLELAARYWKPCALALVVVAALGYRAVLIHERDAARRDAARLSARNAELETSVRQMTEAVKRQNAAVAALAERAKAASARFATRSRAADARAERTDERAETMARRLAQARIESGCAAAIRWGDREAMELSRW